MNSRQAINLLKGLEQSLDDYCELNDEGKAAFRMAIEALELFGNAEQLPSAQPSPRWIPCSERLPEVSYDILGNWSSDSVLLVFKDGHYDIGYFNPCGVFEIYDIGNECPVIVGTVKESDEAWQIVAWMPLPEPYMKGDTT